jgi:hypothetical protein
MFENRVDLGGRKEREAGDDFVMRSFLTCTLQEMVR